MISEETIAAVKERSDVAALIGENVKLQRRGRTLWGLCPFHKEKTPSFTVNPERNWFHCFGCGKHGSALDYLMELESLPFPEAVRALAERFGVEIKTTGSPADEDREARARRDKEELYNVSKLCALYFVEQLGDRGHPLRSLAVAELGRRALALGASPEVDASLASFFIGYAPYGWDNLAEYLRRQGISLVLAERLGLVAARKGGDGHYDTFRHRLMFAVVDKSGRVVAFSGRALEEPPDELLARHRIAPMSRPRAAGDEEYRAPPKYINSPESPIYVKGETVFGLFQARQAIRERAEAILVEGNFDVLSLHARGLATAVAPLGTAFTEAQAKLIKRYAPTVVVLFDGDDAGRKATLAVRAPAREAALHVRVASLPEGTDPDDLSRNKGIAAVEALTKNARGMLEHLIETTLGRLETRGSWSNEEALERIKRVTAYIDEEKDPTMQAMATTYADAIADRIPMAGQSARTLKELHRLVGQALREPSDRPRRQLTVRENGTLAGDSGMVRHTNRVDLEIVGLFIDFPEFFDDPELQWTTADLTGDTALAAAAIRQEWDHKRALFGRELLDLLPQAIHSFAVGRLATPKVTDLGEARTELIDNAKKLRRVSLKGDTKLDALDDADVEAQEEHLRVRARAARAKEQLRLTKGPRER